MTPPFPGLSPFGHFSNHSSGKQSPIPEHLRGGGNRSDFRVAGRTGICGAGYWRRRCTKKSYINTHSTSPGPQPNIKQSMSKIPPAALVGAERRVYRLQNVRITGVSSRWRKETAGHARDLGETPALHYL